MQHAIDGLKWAFQPDPQNSKHQGLAHPLFTLLLGCSFNLLVSYTASKTLMRFPRFKEPSIPIWARKYISKLIALYLLFMVGSRYYAMGNVAFYDILWTCNGSMMNLVMALHLDFPFLAMSSLLSVALDQTLWYLDLLSYLWTGKFAVGVMKYLTWPQTSWAQIITGIHHLWFLPLCLIIIRRCHKFRFESYFFAMLLILTFCFVSRVLIPKEILYPDGKSLYLNVNVVWDSWKDVKNFWICTLYDSSGTGSMAYFLYVQFFWNLFNLPLFGIFYLLHKLVRGNMEKQGFSIDMNSLVTALLNSVSPDRSTMKLSLLFLEEESTKPDFVRALFYLIDQYRNNSNNIDLLGVLYLKKHFEKAYKSMKEGIKTESQELVLKAFFSDVSTKVREQLYLILSTLVTVEFPHSATLDKLLTFITLDNPPNLLEPLFKAFYVIFKALTVEVKRNKPNLMRFLEEYFQRKSNVFNQFIELAFAKLNEFAMAIENNPDIQMISNVGMFMNEGLTRLALKILKIEVSLPGIAKPIDAPLYLENLDFLEKLGFIIFKKLLAQPNFFTLEAEISIALKVRKLIYLYHKVFIVALEQKKVALEQIPSIIDYVKRFYIYNKDLFLNNPAVYNVEDFKDIKKMEEIQNNHVFIQIIDNETLLIIQALRIMNQVLNDLAVFAMDDLKNTKYDGSESLEEHYLDGERRQEVFIEKYFNEELYTGLMDFLLNKVLILNCSSLLTFHFNQENYFNEYFNAHLEFDLRMAGADLLKSCYLYVNPYKISTMIVSLLAKCQDQNITEISLFSDILRREAFYFLIAALYREIKNDLSFEEWFSNSLKSELLIENPLFNPLKIQILNIINLYLEVAFTLPKTICLDIFEVLFSLFQNHDSIIIKLFCVKGFIPLFESNLDLIVHVNVLMKSLFQLINSVRELDTKSLILDFIENLVRKFKTMLNPHIFEIYTFLENEWTLNLEESQTLIVKSKILNILNEIVLKIGLHLEKFESYITIISTSLSVDDISEIYLIENGLRLLFFYLQAINSNNIIIPQEKGYFNAFCRIFEQIKTIFLEKIFAFKICLLIILEFINMNLFYISPNVGELLVETFKRNQSEVKDELLLYLLDVFDYWCIFQQPNSMEMIQKFVTEIFNTISGYPTENVFKNKFKLELLKLLSRGFLLDAKYTSQIILSLGQGPALPLHLLLELDKSIEEIVPKIHYKKSFVFFGINILCSHLASRQEVSLENQIASMNLNPLPELPEQTSLILQKITKYLLALKIYYEKTVEDEEHWIYASMEEMIENDENYDQNEIKMLKSTTTLKVLREDKMKRMDIFQIYREMIGNLEGIYGEGLNLSSELRGEIKSLIEY